jgi:malonate transporter and related proteins
VQTALLILPSFMLILIGLALARAFDYGRDFWEGLEKLVYFVLFPALLFRSIAVSTIDLASLLAVVGSAWGILLLAVGLAALTRPIFKPEPILAASCAQCAFRFNTYIGFAVAGSLFGPPGLAVAALLAGAVVPLANLFAVAFLARHGKRGFLGELVRNPLIVSTVAGFLFNLAGLKLPDFADRTLDLLGSSALPAGLLAVGAALRLEPPHGAMAPHAWWLAVKLLVKPLAAFACIRLFGLTGVEAGVLMLWASLPCASSAYILAVRMNGDGPAVATQVTAGTLIAMVTIPLWMLSVT